MDHARRSLSTAIVAIEFIATFCQFMQQTDPRFPFVYFTVSSGFFAGVVAAVELSRWSPRGLPYCRVSAAVGVILSALIFIAIIAPATPTGTWFQPWDDAWVRIATMLFHGLAPVLVLARLVVSPYLGRIRSWLAAAYAWPVLYLIVTALGSSLKHWRIPYPFLSPTQIGWHTVLFGIAAMTVLIAVTTALLYAGARVASRRIG